MYVHSDSSETRGFMITRTRSVVKDEECVQVIGRNPEGFVIYIDPFLGA
jgi:hypothetical protein